MSNPYRKYARKRFTRLRELLISLETQCDPKVVHHARIELRRIRALLKVVHFGNQKFRDHTFFRPFKRVHRILGQLRDPYVVQSLVQNVSENDGQTRLALPIQIPEPNGILLAFQQELPALVEGLDRQEAVVVGKAGKVNKKLMKKYLRRKQRGLKRMIHPKLKTRELHDIRKTIRDMIYLMDIKGGPGRVPAFFTWAAELLGDWHDKTLLIGLIRDSEAELPGLIDHLRNACHADLKQFRKRSKKHFG